MTLKKRSNRHDNTFYVINNAPNADVILYANGDFYGSIVSNNFELKAGGNYHYDESLKEVEVDDIGVRFVIKRWYDGNPESLNPDI